MQSRDDLEENVLPEDIQDLYDLKQELLIKQINLKESGRNETSFLTSTSFLEAELINKIKNTRSLANSDIVKRIEKIENELAEIWNPQILVQLCANYIYDVIRRYKFYTSNDENKLYTIEVDQFLLGLKSFVEVISAQFLQPLMQDIKYLYEVTGGAKTITYQQIEIAIAEIHEDFKILKSEHEVLGLTAENHGRIVLMDEYAMKNYNSSDCPVWQYLLQESEVAFDEYLSKRSTTCFDKSDISDLHLRIRSKFGWENLIKDIFAVIDQEVELASQAPKVSVSNNQHQQYSEISFDMPENEFELQHSVRTVKDNTLLQPALMALDLVRFTQEDQVKVELCKQLLRDNIPLQQALSASYHYLTQANGFYHGEQGKKAVRKLIRNLVHQEDLSLPEIQKTVLQCIKGDGEYGRWFRKSGSGHHKSSRVSFFLESKLFNDKNEVLSRQCRITPGMMGFFSQEIKFRDLKYCAGRAVRRDITAQVKKLR
jgi:hypothetical protein